MIIVQSTFHLLPETLESAIKQMKHMAKLCVEEAGCLNYEYFQGVSNPSQVVLLQEWEDGECLQAHYQTKHMEEFVSKLGKYLESPVMTRSYISQEEKFPSTSEDKNSESERVVH